LVSTIKIMATLYLCPGYHWLWS